MVIYNINGRNNMSRIYITGKIEIRKKISSGGFSSSAITLYDYKDVKVKKGLAKRKDTFQFTYNQGKRNNLYETKYSGDGATKIFTLTHGPIDADFVQGGNQKVFVYVGGSLQGYTTNYTISSSTLTFVSAPVSGVDNIRVVFQVIDTGDLCRIYQNRDSATLGNSQVLIEGIIQKPSTVADTNVAETINYNGTGIIEQIFSSLVFVKDNSLVKPHLIIQNCITQINNYNRLRKIYGADPTEWSNIGNATTKSDSVAFPDIQYYASYRSALEIIEEISSDRYTKDGNYYYYILYDAANDRYEFNWSYKNPSLTSGLSITDGDAIKQKIYKDDSATINTIIYNVGLDCYEVPWEFLNFAQVNIVGTSAKWRYILQTNHLISDLLNLEFEADTSLWTTGTEGNRVSNFPIDTSSWTFQFEARNADGTPTGSAATATSDTTFNDAIVEEAKWLGKEATDRILEMAAVARIKAEYDFPFNTTYSLGDLVPITNKQFGVTNYPLRVVELEYTDKNTTVFLEEDETTAIERVVNG